MNSKSKKVLIAVVILLAIALISLLSVTVAYLSSRRSAEGYLNFAPGLSIEYENIEDKGSAQSFGNLYHFVDGDDDGEIDDGELEGLDLKDIQPGQVIRIANPKLAPKEGTATFALRAKLVLTDENSVKHQTKDELEELLNGADPLLYNGYHLNFGEGWEYGGNGWFYRVTPGTDPVLERLEEISYNDQSATQQEIYLFDGDDGNENLATIKIIDGKPIEQIPVKSLKIELYIEAIEMNSIEYWNA